MLPIILATAVSTLAQNKPSPQADNSFSPHIASQLLSQVREGVEGRSQKKMFAAFALNKMENGPLFKQQIAGLFNRTETIRVHLNLVEASATAETQASVQVDAEMEADPRDNSLPVHKRARLTFTVEKTATGWKFVDVQPRSFFSL